MIATITFGQAALGVAGVVAFASLLFLVIYAVISGMEDFK